MDLSGELDWIGRRRRKFWAIFQGMARKGVGKTIRTM